MIKDYISIIQREINEAFMNFLQRKYSDRTFSKTWDGQIVVDADRDMVYETMVESLEPTWIEPHIRINKDGGETLVKGYFKEQKEMGALDVAKLEQKDEAGQASGINIGAEFEAFIEALQSGTISLGSMNFKG